MVKTKICIQCNKEFVLNRKDKKYCSETCRWAAKEPKLIAKNLKIYGCKYPTYMQKLLYEYSIIKDKCDHCGFVALHPCQLDVHHIDGDYTNNIKSNLQILCANCHRLKTFIHKQGFYI